MQSTLPSQGVDTKKEDNLTIVFFGAVRRGLECCAGSAPSPTRKRSQDSLGARISEEVTPLLSLSRLQTVMLFSVRGLSQSDESC